MSTKKQLEEALAASRELLDVATKWGAEQESLATARLAELQVLQDEVVDLQVGLGAEVDLKERYREMMLESDAAVLRLESRLGKSPGEKLLGAIERFKGALRRRGD
jgi:hypothetical protein